MLRLIKTILCFIVFFSLTACNNAHHDKTLKVGTISGPDVQLLETAKKVAKEKYNLDIKIIEFTDYVQPNTSLADGSIDANMFQHQPYLDQQIKDRHFKLVVVGKTFVFPMGIYSTKIKELNHLPQRAIVAIPNDPSNEGRALLLLQKVGLIKLSDTVGLYATPANITNNPKRLTFKELDSAQLARSLPDVDIAIINTNYAISAGLSPKKDAIFYEDSHSPYANIIVIREDEANDPRIKQLVAAIQSNEVMETAKQIFNDQAIPAWQP
jgi:D-methionine transport system substrate-binding protein